MKMVENDAGMGNTDNMVQNTDFGVKHTWVSNGTSRCIRFGVIYMCSVIPFYHWENGNLSSAYSCFLEKTVINQSWHLN